MQVKLGGIDNLNIHGISGGWSRSFTLDSPQKVSVSFRFKLTQSAEYEGDEFSETLVAINDTVIGTEVNGTLVRIFGDGDGGMAQTTDWALVNLDLGSLAADEMHVLTIGAFNNKKTVDNELTELVIDDIVVRGVANPPSSVVFENRFDNDQEEFSYADDALRGTNRPAYASGRYVSKRWDFPVVGFKLS